MTQNKIWILFLIPLLLGILSMSIYATDYTYKQNSAIDLKAICFNDTNSFCDSSVTCNLTIFSPNASVLINNKNMTFNSAYYNFSLSSAETSGIGEYSAIVLCDGLIDGYSTFTYKITPSGYIGTTGEAVVYSAVTLAIIFLLSAAIMGFLSIKGKNIYDVGGNLIKINYGKYLKVALFFAAYLLLLLLSFLIWQLTYRFLAYGIIVGLFKAIFIILIALLAPAIIITTIFGLMQWLLDTKLWNLHTRRLKPR